MKGKLQLEVGEKNSWQSIPYGQELDLYATLYMGFLICSLSPTHQLEILITSLYRIADPATEFGFSGMEVAWKRLS